MACNRPDEDGTTRQPLVAPPGEWGAAGANSAGEPPTAPGPDASPWLWLRFWLSTLPHIPLPFLGLGIYRAWLNAVLGGGAFFGASGVVVSQNAFDFAMIASLFICAFGARRITPLYRQGALKAACLILLVGSTLLGYAAWGGVLPVLAVAWPSTVAGGVGIALMILLWSELYGTLSPVRICLYYCASLVAGAVVGWVYEGFRPEWLPVMTAVLPLVSFGCLRACYREGLVEPLHPRSWARFSFPWKPVLVVAIYSFAYGLLQVGTSEVARSTSAVGTVACCLVVMAAVVLLRSRVEFGSVYGVWLPFMSAVFLILAAVVGPASWWGNLWATWGYAASQVFIMTMVGSICYHWGASAIWLFGIERGVRSLATLGGRLVEGQLAVLGMSATPVLVVAVMVATFVAFSEKKLDADWGVELAKEQKDPELSQGVERRNALVRACAALAQARNLSQREEEVLLLLAQHKTARDIERELCVANGTAKAHIRHVYQKLGIHTREELFEQVEGARGDPAV